MPSHLDMARSGLRARRVRSALKAPMFPIPAPSAPKLIIEIYNRQLQATHAYNKAAITSAVISDVARL